jgi:hypothetical protein
MSGRPGLTLLGRHTTMQPPENEKKYIASTHFVAYFNIFVFPLLLCVISMEDSFRVNNDFYSYGSWRKNKLTLYTVVYLYVILACCLVSTSCNQIHTVVPDCGSSCKHCIIGT